MPAAETAMLLPSGHVPSLLLLSTTPTYIIRGLGGLRRLQLQSLQEGQQQQQQQQDSLQDAATAATDGAAGPSSQALPAGGSKEAAAAPVPGAQQQDAVSPKPPDIAFGINWDQRVKVYADMFLVEKLRPHQREGVK